MEATEVVLVHGLPETAEIWAPLQARLERETTAVALPGFGYPRPSAFTGTKDAYAQWLADALSRFDTPVDVVGHDIGAGAHNLARTIGARHDEEMSRSILDFYRSAVPNVAADWWEDAAGARRARGLVLLLPDRPEEEAMSLEVAERLGAETARLDDLNHCWMAEAPDETAAVLERFWATITRPS